MRFRGTVVVAMGLAALLLANMGVLTGDYVPRGDGRGWFAPYFSLLADHLRQGMLLSWDPWSATGVPSSTEPQAGAFSPVTMLFAWISGGSIVGYNWYFFSTSCIAFCGTYLLARHYRVGRFAAIAIAFSFAACGVFLGQPHHSHLVPMAFAPWILWRLDVWVRTHQVMPALQAGALGGLAGLYSHPAVLMYCAAFIGLWLTGRLLLYKRRSSHVRPNIVRRAVWPLATLALSAAVAVAIISPLYVGFALEGRGVHNRDVPTPIAQNQSYPLHPDGVSMMLSPVLAELQLVVPTTFPGSLGTLCSVYCGIPVVLFALAAFLARPLRLWYWWLLAVGVLFLAAAMGSHLPVQRVLLENIPPLRLFRYAAVLRVGWILAATVLAIHGARELRIVRRRSPLATWITAGVLGLGTIAWAGYCFVSIPPMIATLPARGLAPYYAAVVLALGLLATCLACARSRRWQMAIVVVIALLAAADYGLTRHMTLRLTFDRASGEWGDMKVRRSTQLDLMSNGWMRELGKPGANNTPVVTKKPVFLAYTTLQGGLLSTLTQSPAMLATAVGTNRVWFAPKAALTSANADVLGKLMVTANALKRPILAVHPPEAMVGASYLPAATAETAVTTVDWDHRDEAIAKSLPADLLVYTPTEIVFHTICPTAGWVMLTDRWAPAWRARVNGEPAELWGANTLFRAVQVKAGRNVIRFIYRPPYRKALLAVSWTCLASVGVLSLLACRSPRRKKERFEQSLKFQH